MNAPTVDVKDMIEAESSIGLVFATDLFIGSMPDTPEDCTCLYDTPGLPPQITLGVKKDDEGYYYPSVQVRVRNRSYIVGYALIDAIKLTLHGRSAETWGGSLYTAIFCSSEPALLQIDEKRLANFVTTFNLQRR